ncbi:hypothetical protein G9A89_021883 [Geosiphon pyriformis]|nr:hypothetical protein G9A89_021883 [Geosiphon pyriformis]
MWNNISRKEGMCDELCQYTILISNWVRKETLINTAWRQTVKCLDGCLYNDDEIWQIALTKIKEALPKEIRTIKNNSPKLIKLDWDPKPVINFLDLEQFHEHY